MAKFKLEGVTFDSLDDPKRKKFRRYFNCLKCGKRTNDLGEGSRNDPLLGKIEFETIDLCESCFRNEVKRMRQNYILLDLHARKLVSMPEMEKLAELAKLEDKKDYEKFRGELLRRNEMHKGDMKKRKLEMIERLKEKNKIV